MMRPLTDAAEGLSPALVDAASNPSLPYMGKARLSASKPRFRVCVTREYTAGEVSLSPPIHSFGRETPSELVNSSEHVVPAE